MKSGGVLIWVVLLIAVLVVGVQFRFHEKAAKRQATPEIKPACQKTQATYIPEDKQGSIMVFGREYSENQVRSWFAKVDGRYCCRNGTIYPFGSAPGKAFTYKQFVRALKQGHYFPELAGEGVISDGEKVMLQNEGFHRTKKNTSQVHLTN